MALRGPPHLRHALQLQLRKEQLKEMVRDLVPTAEPLVSREGAEAFFRDTAIGSLVRVVTSSTRNNVKVKTGRVCRVASVSEGPEYNLDEVPTTKMVGLKYGEKISTVRLTALSDALLSQTELDEWLATFAGAPAEAPTAAGLQAKFDRVRHVKEKWQRVKDAATLQRQQAAAGRLGAAAAGGGGGAFLGHKTWVPPPRELLPPAPGTPGHRHDGSNGSAAFAAGEARPPPLPPHPSVANGPATMKHPLYIASRSWTGTKAGYYFGTTYQDGLGYHLDIPPQPGAQLASGGGGGSKSSAKPNLPPSRVDPPRAALPLPFSDYAKAGGGLAPAAAGLPPGGGGFPRGRFPPQQGPAGLGGLPPGIGMGGLGLPGVVVGGLPGMGGVGPGGLSPLVSLLEKKRAADAALRAGVPLPRSPSKDLAGRPVLRGDAHALDEALANKRSAVFSSVLKALVPTTPAVPGLPPSMGIPQSTLGLGLGLLQQQQQQQQEQMHRQQQAELQQQQEQQELQHQQAKQQRQQQQRQQQQQQQQRLQKQQEQEQEQRKQYQQQEQQKQQQQQQQEQHLQHDHRHHEGEEPHGGNRALERQHEQPLNAEATQQQQKQAEAQPPAGQPDASKQATKNPFDVATPVRPTAAQLKEGPFSLSGQWSHTVLDTKRAADAAPPGSPSQQPVADPKTLRTLRGEEKKKRTTLSDLPEEVRDSVMQKAREDVLRSIDALKREAERMVADEEGVAKELALRQETEKQAQAGLAAAEASLAQAVVDLKIKSNVAASAASRVKNQYEDMMEQKLESDTQYRDEIKKWNIEAGILEFHIGAYLEWKGIVLEADTALSTVVDQQDALFKVITAMTAKEMKVLEAVNARNSVIADKFRELKKRKAELEDEKASKRART
ncbi:hypothetical protein DIPPA_12556 [Diplonema papillatum]|nr:hypothetical protein DIPPA_12556 [Diplonema papillatum]